MHILCIALKYNKPNKLKITKVKQAEKYIQTGNWCSMQCHIQTKTRLNQHKAITAITSLGW